MDMETDQILMNLKKKTQLLENACALSVPNEKAVKDGLKELQKCMQHLIQQEVAEEAEEDWDHYESILAELEDWELAYKAENAKRSCFRLRRLLLFQTF